MKLVSHIQKCRGAALVAVLALIVLLAALVTVFLVRTAVQRSASASYDAAAGTRLLSETTVNLVQATINEATSGTGGMAWASQPGAIRVFNSVGNQERIYRLYSGTEIATSNSSGAVLASDMPPAGWANSPSVWVDLNKPVTVTGFTGSVPYLVFPILDPRDPLSPGNETTSNVLTSLEGFSISPAPGSTALQPAPMPVRWLYVLRNGNIVTPTVTGSNVVVPGATANNPISGRIAYWTDDETAKVNINTAAGSLATWSGTNTPGTWDTPRFKIWLERMLFSENQPVKGEYQRYPGHPATTDLYKILSSLGIPLTDYPYVVQSYAANPQPNVSAPPTATSGLFALLPRYTDVNSSRAGSRNTTTTVPAPQINSGVPRQDRLYPSVGELTYAPNRNSSSFSRQQLETGKFFLTAQSRAPEVNLFGTPRIAMWPIDSSNLDSRITAYDRLIAFCATTGVNRYFVQRFDSRDPQNDYTNIPRNQNLFTYLQDLTNRDIPGFGGKFSSKYSYTSSTANERDQLLTLMLDYIRTTNLHDNSTTTGLVRFTDNPSTVPVGDYTFAGQATPLKIAGSTSTTRGLGRAYTFSEIGVQIICTAEGSTTPHFNYQTSATTVGYQAAVDIDPGPPVVLVSPANGSANDPQYASNLPVAQYLRSSGTGAGVIVGLDPTTRAPVFGTETAPPASADPFPANQTLTTTGEHGGPLQALAPGEKRLQAMLLFEIACPMMGYDIFKTNTRPAFRVKVSSIENISIGAQSPFPSRETTDNSSVANLNGNGFVDRIGTRNAIYGTGGLLGFRYLLGEQREHFNAWSGKTPAAPGDPPRPYRYVSNPFTVSGSSMSLGGNFSAELHYLTSTVSSLPYQTFNVTFPPASIPVPDLMLNGLSGSPAFGTNTTNIPSDWWGFDFRIARAREPRINDNKAAPNTMSGAVIRADQPRDTVTFPLWQWNTVREVRVPTFDNQTNAALFNGSDVVRTLVARDGDYRLAAARETVNADNSSDSPFVKGPGYDDATKKLGHLFKDQATSFNTAGVDNTGKLAAGAPYSFRFTPKVPTTLSNPNIQLTWDWDNGLPFESDGAYAGKPDEGNAYTAASASDRPYYNREQEGDAKIPSYFTANRIVTSPVMFGSLPTGSIEGIAWRTPLFRPSPAANRPLDPPGPKDSLLLDLFWMPVVEPYAISEPFSTAGKVNMNYQIVPFTYITRNTGVRAVLSSELIARVPKAAAAANTTSGDTYYKGIPGSSASTPPGSPSVARLPVNLNETLKQFDQKFFDTANPLQPKDIFKSATEICDVYLVPEGYTLDQIQGTSANSWYGDDFALVGDNARERPYGNIYPRLTTKSNTFTVHYTVQTLKNPPSADPSIWIESRGVVTGELRGSNTLERFLDPTNPNIPDYATNSGAASLDTFYQWRVISNSTFAP